MHLALSRLFLAVTELASPFTPSVWGMCLGARPMRPVAGESDPFEDVSEILDRSVLSVRDRLDSVGRIPSRAGHRSDLLGEIKHSRVETHHDFS